MSTAPRSLPDLTSKRRLTTTRQMLRHLAIFAGLFVVMAILARHSELANRPLAEAINYMTSTNRALTSVSYLAAGPKLQGIILVAMLCYSWFLSADDGARARLLAGVAAAVCAGILAQLVEASFISSPKPLFDQTLHFRTPDNLPQLATMRSEAFYDMHTFPSPRAALYFAIALIIFPVQPLLGALAICVTLLIEAARVIIGFHYPTDIAGSVMLAAASVSASQLPPFLAACSRILDWKSVHRAAFYTCFLMLLLELSVAFDHVRQMLTALRLMWHS